MSTFIPTFYVKTGCPWCTEARAVLDAAQVHYREVDVSRDPAAFQTMRELSGQTYVPVLDWNGEVLADFGAAELKPFLSQRGVTVK